MVSWLVACSPGAVPEPPLAAVYDLAARLPTAEIVVETRRVDPGSPDGRRHLLSGFSRDEVDPRGRRFAWAVGASSVVELQLLEPRDLDLVLEGRPFRYEGAPRQGVTVSINGHPVGELEMLPGLVEYELRLFREQLAAGSNRLELAYRHRVSPRELGLSNDRRQLAVAWYRLRLGVGGRFRPPRVEAGAPPVLFVPFGSQIDYYLELAPSSELRVDRWSFRGKAVGRLEVELGADDGNGVGVEVIEGTGAGSAKAYPLGVEKRRVVRLRLRAVAQGEPGGIELANPRIWSPTPRRELGPPAALVVTDGPTARRPNIVLYLIDTLRADHLGCYGYGRPVSPRIDAFAEQAVLFEHAVAQSSWTKASVASIFTGQWPRAHGANRRSDRLAAAAVTLPERLRAAGYRTAAFVTNPNVTTGFGFGQGFDEFSYLGEETGSDGVHRAVVDWLDARSDAIEQPFFLYVHTLDPHAPYAAPESFRRRLAPAVDDATARRSGGIVDDLQAGRIEVSEAAVRDLEALYEAEIAFNDYNFGKLLDELESRGLFDEALVILVSDHGEELYEHGNFQHGRSLHAESIDVPMLLKLPHGRQVAGRRVARRAQHVDLLPTVLAYLGLPPGSAVEGTNLLPLTTSGASADDVRVFSYLHLDGAPSASVQDDGWKLIQRLDHGTLVWPRLYRLADDPVETENLAERFPIRAGYLAAQLREKLAVTEHLLVSEEAMIDDEVRKGLEALGYLD